MRLLLDTQALLWWLMEPERLKTSTKEAIDRPAHQVAVSVVSLWEIAIKHRIGKLKGELSEIIAVITDARFVRLGIDDRHLLELQAMPLHHKDPFDRLLIAQAIVEKRSFVSGDQQARLYPVDILPC